MVFYFPLLTILQQEYLSLMFCSFIYLRSSFCPLVSLRLFTVSPLSFSWQKSKCSAAQLQQVLRIFKTSDRVKIADLSLALAHHLFFFLWAPWNMKLSQRFLSSFKKELEQEGYWDFLPNFLHISKFSCHKWLKMIIWIRAHSWWD